MICEIAQFCGGGRQFAQGLRDLCDNSRLRSEKGLQESRLSRTGKSLGATG